MADDLGIRDILTQLREDTVRHLDRIERKLDQKADAGRLELVDDRVRQLERTVAMRLDLEDLEARVLSQDSIRQMIGSALQDADSRGWTSRERRLAIATFMILLTNLMIGLLTLGPDLWR